VRIVDELGACVLEVDVEHGGGPAHEWHHVVLSALAQTDEELTAEEVHVPQVEPLALPDLDRRAIEQLEDGAVALAPHREGIGARHEPPALGPEHGRRRRPFNSKCATDLRPPPPLPLPDGP
jgi:hypothetical protein